MRVLAVDDDLISLDLVRYALSGISEVELVVRRSAEAALLFLDETEDPFDCFLLDINMGGMNGVELCRTIRSYPEHETTPIIMMTRLDHRLYVERALKAGADDYLVKPLDTEDLAIRVRSILGLGVPAGEDDDDEPETRGAPEAPGVPTEYFELNEIDNATGYHDLLASLKAMPIFTPLGFCSLRIVNIDELAETLGVFEFRRTITAVARVLSLALNEQDVVMAYAGNGEIDFVVKGRDRIAPDSLADTVNDWFAELKLPGQVAPRVVVAGDSCASYPSRSHRMLRVRQTAFLAASKAAEAKRRERLEAYGVAPVDERVG
ncbi:response regulator [Litorisediminicola beolgyonensis]|uniref:PleD family two-component system response regulator n=1 Tax=Litorisediminicola beolgyonensis TaxID=1173614 RepID=A0ABW3ZNZ1_9RHOB